MFRRNCFDASDRLIIEPNLEPPDDDEEEEERDNADALYDEWADKE